MSREMRSQGSVYLRGSTWWISYWTRGICYRESAHSPERKAALKLLKLRLGESSKGQFVGSIAEKVTLLDMQQALLTDYRAEGNRSIATAEHFARNLLAYFGSTKRALDITADKRIRAYAEAPDGTGALKREHQSRNRVPASHVCTHGRSQPPQSR